MQDKHTLFSEEWHPTLTPILPAQVPPEGKKIIWGNDVQASAVVSGKARYSRGTPLPEWGNWTARGKADITEQAMRT